MTSQHSGKIAHEARFVNDVGTAKVGKAVECGETGSLE